MAHPPRILLLYGSLRERSYSRLLVEEADRLLRLMGAETRIFDPRESADRGQRAEGPSQGAGAAGAVAVVRGPGLVQPGAARRRDGRVQEPD